MKITILQGAFLPVPPLRGGAIEKAWQGLGEAFVETGHEVTHISRLWGDLPAREKIRGCSTYAFVAPVRPKTLSS